MSTAAALRDVSDLPDVTGLVAEAAKHPEASRVRELELLERYRRGDDEGILRQLRTLAAAQPSLAASLHETLAGLYLRERRLYRASQHLAAIPRQRRTAQASFFEASIAARQRRLDAALAGLRARLLDTRADLLFRLGRTAEAYAAYRELSTTVGGISTPESWHRLGDLALSAGDVADARRAFEEALDLGRDYPQRSQAVEALERLPATPPRK